ncbi:MAG: AAA family ATPase, partial [Muricoprocola sp.]
NLQISKDESFQKYRNQYNTISLNMQEFFSRSNHVENLIDRLKRAVIRELKKEYPSVDYFDDQDLAQCMADIYEESRCPFVMIIDEWDCIFREYKEDRGAQERYLDFLRDLLKDKGYLHLVYMTGILPIKKYGTHSALNMFSEFSMTNPRQLAEYVGFTESEVEALCDRYHMNLSEVKEWYDGYRFENIPSIYSPKSVIEAVTSGVCDTYWNQTETFEALRTYIDLNFEGLRDDVLSMMAGEKIPVNTGSFSNDMTTFYSEDDVLTLLIHLGYLGYDFSHKCVFIPNNEIREEFINAVSVSQWGEVSKALKNSADTLNAIWQNRPSVVEKGIEQAHFETSHLQYNDENALSYTISLALYSARNFYTVYRELPTGKRFADMVFIPRKKYPDKPALVVELKWDKNAQGAISQIKKKEYCRSLEEYWGNLLLVGINYDKETRKHECVIEKWDKM